MASRLDFSQIRSLYVGTSSNVTVGTDNLVVAGNVGIGTTSPGAKKLVVTGASNDEWIATFTNTGTNPYGVYIDTSANSSGGYTFAAYTNAGTGFFVKNNGNFLIGTTTDSGYKLAVNGKAVFGTGQSLEIGNAAANPIDSGISYGIFHQSGVGLGIVSGAGGTTQGIDFWSNDGTNYFQSMRISGGNGNVGIGTTTPAVRFQVAGQTSFYNGVASTGAIDGGVFEQRTVGFNLGPSESIDISTIGLTSNTTWKAILSAEYANNLEGGGLTSSPLEIELDSDNPTVLVGSTNITLSRNASTGKLQATNNNASYRVTFVGSIKIWNYPQSAKPTISKVILKNVGIGITNPTIKLDVDGPGRFVSNVADSRVLYLKQDATNSGNIVQFQDQVGTNIWEITGRNNQFYIYNNLVGYSLYIHPATNNISIGSTTDAGYKLQVEGSIRSVGAMEPSTTAWVDAAFTTKVGGSAYGGGVALIDGTSGWAMYTTGSGQFLNLSSGSTSGGVTPRMVLTNAGAASFTSGVTATHFTGAFLDYKPGGVETFFIGKSSYNVFNDTQLGIGTFTSIPIEFATANTKRMIILAGGNVAIGNENTSDVSERLNVTGNGIAIEATDGGIRTLMGTFGSTDSIVGTYTNNNLQIRTNNTSRIFITAGGNVLIGTTTDSGEELVVNGNIGVPFSTQIRVAGGGYTRNDIITTGYNNGGDLKDYLILDAPGSSSGKIIIGSSAYVSVGIGTTAPKQKLIVEGTLATKPSGVDGYYSYLRSNWSQDNAFELGISEDGANTFHKLITSSDYYFGSTLQFWTSDTEKMRITGAGNVGIGTTNPAMKLHVSDVGANIVGGNAISTSTMKGVMIQNTNNGDESVGVWFNTGGNHWSGISGQRTSSATNWATDLRFYTHEAATNDLTYSRERMRINSEGNVLIGTDTDIGTKLNVNGTSYISGAASFGSTIDVNGNVTLAQDANDLIFQQTNSSTHGIVWKNTAYAKDSASIRPTGNGAWATQGIGFYTGNAGNSTTAPSLRFNIQAGGDSIFYNNVGIGTTAPDVKLHVQGSNAKIRLTGDTYTSIELEDGGTGDPGYLKTYYYGSVVSQIGVAGTFFNTGNIGIGTSSPTVHSGGNALVVKGESGVGSGRAIIELHESGGTEGKAVFQQVGSTTYIGNLGGNGALSLLTGGSGSSANESVFISNAGNVGIGTTSPADYSMLHVNLPNNKGARFGSWEVYSYAVNNAWLGENVYFDGSNFKYRNNGYANLLYSDAAGGFQIRMTNGTGTAGNNISYATNLSIKPNGNVQIGSTTDSGYKLYVNGTGYFNGVLRASVSNTFPIRAINPTQDICRISFQDSANSSNDAVWVGSNGFDLALGAGYEERMRINSSGFAGIATFPSTDWTLSLGELPGGLGSLDTTSSIRISYGALGVGVNPSATIGRIDASNDIVAYSTSDSRLKENITPIANALDKVKSLTGVEFDWKEETKDVHGYEGHDVGVIAQEVQAVLPEAIRTNDTGYLSVRYEKMIALLIEGMKEQQNQIDELKAKLDGLTK